jgi:hypothetical protein
LEFEGRTLAEAWAAPGSPEYAAGWPELSHLLLADVLEVFQEVHDGVNEDYRDSISLGVSVPEDEDWMVFLRLQDRRSIVTEISMDSPLTTDEEEIRATLSPLLTEYDWRLLEIAAYRNSDAVVIGFDVPPMTSIGQVMVVGNVIQRIMTKEVMQPTSPFGVHSLILTGTVKGLLGQPESQWLEAKQKGYGLDNDRQKHELAMDVAALANTDRGGVIVIGFATKRDDASRDVITSAGGCSLGSLDSGRYAEILQTRVVPPLEGIDIQVVEAERRHFMSIFISPQPDYMKPILVKGGVMEGDRWTGGAFSIPNRVGSSKWALSAEAVHSLLVAARVALAAHSDGITVPEQQ